MEQWKWIVYKQHDFTNKYMVSDQGRIKSVDRYTEKQHQFYKGQVIKQKEIKRKGNTSYMSVILWDNGKPFTVEVHRLVANAFLSNPNNLPCVNHIDGNGTNNSMDNLEWCTYSHNVRHSIDDLGNHPKKWKAKPVEQMTLEGKPIETWESAWEIQRKLGYCQVAISKCCTGKMKTAYGYKWRFVKGGDL